MKPILKNSALQRNFDEQGFVVVDLLQVSELEELEKIYAHYFPENADGFFSSSYLNGFALKKEISDRAAAILNPALQKVFINYRPIGSAFLAKAPGAQSELPMHQDWSIVDEQQFYAINVWTPITPITPQNGTLQVLTGSHKHFPEMRAPTIPFAAIGLENLIKPQLTKLHIKPGQCVILSQSLVHYSDANNSDSLRLAITTGVVSDAASFEFHYWDKVRNVLEKYETTEPFLLQFDNFHESIFQRPAFGKRTSEKPFIFEPFTAEKLRATGLIPPEKSAPKPGLLNKLKNLFTR